MALALVFLGLQAAGSPEAGESIQELVEALGSDEAHCRDEASRKLEAFGKSAHPNLLLGLQSPDPEVRARCRRLLQGFRFEGGARLTAKVGVEVPDLRPDPCEKTRYESLAAKGRVDVVLAQDYRWITCIIDGLLSDDSAVIQCSLRAIHQIIRRRGLEAAESDLARGVDLAAFQSAKSRAEEYMYWAQWWFTVSSREAVSRWAVTTPSADKEPWGDIVRGLRGANYKDSSSLDAAELEHIRRLGKDAYPFIIGYIDDPDIEIGRSAVELLERLTGRRMGTLTKQNRGDLRSQWLAWSELKP